MDGFPAGFQFRYTLTEFVVILETLDLGDDRGMTDGSIPFDLIELLIHLQKAFVHTLFQGVDASLQLAQLRG